MSELGSHSFPEVRVYLTGGACAVLLGWREVAIDIDIALAPVSDALFRAFPKNVNVDLASPANFIPPLPSWQERSPLITREGTLDFHHYDFYAQCLAKIERWHTKDVADVKHMLRSGLVKPRMLGELFAEIEPQLLRYPALHAPSFRRRVETTIASA